MHERHARNWNLDVARGLTIDLPQSTSLLIQNSPVTNPCHHALESTLAAARSATSQFGGRPRGIPFVVQSTAASGRTVCDVTSEAMRAPPQLVQRSFHQPVIGIGWSRPGR